MQPGNPIVGGTVLRRVAIQSPNYVAGTSGWAIFQDGTAEFNNVTVRGQLVEGTAPTGSGLIISTTGELSIYDSGGNKVGDWNPSTSILLVQDAAGNKVILDPKNVNGPTLQFQDSTGLNTVSFHQDVSLAPIVTLVVSAATFVDIGSGIYRSTGGYQVNGAYLPYGTFVAPTTSNANGTATTGTTETRDAVLGNYQFTAVSGRRYRAMYRGAINTSIANDLYSTNIRNSGSNATPTAASTLVGTYKSPLPIAGGPGQSGVLATGTFTTAGGTQTLGVFTVRDNGTGVGTPVPDHNIRELWVEDIGGV